MAENYSDSIIENVLLGAYHGLDMNMEEVAEILDTNKGSISYQMKKRDIPTNPLELVGEERIKDMHDDGMTQLDIANYFKTSKTSVNRFLQSKNIEHRGPRGAALNKNPHPNFKSNHGYLSCSARTSEGRKSFYVHRLVAFSHFDGTFEKFKDLQVHHRNKIKCDNRPKNLEALNGRQHQSVHHMDELVEDNGWPVLLSPKYVKENK